MPPRPFEPEDPNFEDRVRESFSRQTAMRTIGATISSISPGEVVVELPYRDDLAQQHGYLHAGIVTAIVDSACGYAALSLMPRQAAVLTVEFKVNFLAPAAGPRFLARGRVIKRGRTLTVCQGDVVAEAGPEKRLVVATMLATMMAAEGRGIAG